MLIFLTTNAREWTRIKRFIRVYQRPFAVVFYRLLFVVKPEKNLRKL
jgi:hypothetical protein